MLGKKTIKTYNKPRLTQNSGIVAFYDIRLGNGVELFSQEEINGEVNKKGKYKQEKTQVTRSEKSK